MENDDEKGDGDCLHRPSTFFSFAVTPCFLVDDYYDMCVRRRECLVVVVLLLLTVCVCNKRKVVGVWVLGLRIFVRMFYPSFIAAVVVVVCLCVTVYLGVSLSVPLCVYTFVSLCVVCM